MYDEVIKLVTRTKTVNEYGGRYINDVEREVFAEILSIGQSEFYQAQALGMKPEIKFELADYLEYHGETIVKYAPFGANEETFSVIRTYRTKSDTIEITCKKGVDSNGIA